MKLSDEDKKLVEYSTKTLNDLAVEVKTIQGFLGNFLSTKYSIKSQEDYQKLLEGGEINLSEIPSEIPSVIPPKDPSKLNLVE